jgi:hypothetical protein
MISPRIQSARGTLILLSVGALLGLASFTLAPSSVALAKEYDVAGTVDCGVPSGRDCTTRDTLDLWTDDVSGTRQLVTVNVSWIKSQLPKLDQDDPIDLEVRDQPDGTIQAIGVAGEGDFVDRMNFGVREEYTTFRDSVRAHVGRARDDDERMNDKGVRRHEDLHHR